MKSLRWRAAATFGVVVLVAAVLAGTAAGESRNRGVERLLAGGMYSADDGTKIQRAFASAMRAEVRERDALEFVEICVSGELDAAHVVRVLSIVAQLSLENLPIGGVQTKLEEGVSKRVPQDRIVQAVERRALSLSKAKLIINGLVLQGIAVEDRDDLLPDLAAALEAGRSPEQARDILSGALKAGEGSGSIRRKLFP